MLKFQGRFWDVISDSGVREFGLWSLGCLSRLICMAKNCDSVEDLIFLFLFFVCFAFFTASLCFRICISVRIFHLTHHAIQQLCERMNGPFWVLVQLLFSTDFAVPLLKLIFYEQSVGLTVDNSS